MNKKPKAYYMRNNSTQSIDIDSRQHQRQPASIRMMLIRLKAMFTSLQIVSGIDQIHGQT